MENNEEKGKYLTINFVMSSLLADIDIFLLKEKDQITDKEKQFTVDEIRNQLESSGQKLNSTLKQLGINIHEKLDTKIIDIGDFEIT